MFTSAINLWRRWTALQKASKVKKNSARSLVGLNRDCSRDDLKYENKFKNGVFFFPRESLRSVHLKPNWISYMNIFYSYKRWWCNFWRHLSHNHVTVFTSKTQNSVDDSSNRSRFKGLENCFNSFFVSYDCFERHLTISIWCSGCVTSITLEHFFVDNNTNEKVVLNG